MRIANWGWRTGISFGFRVSGFELENQIVFNSKLETRNPKLIPVRHPPSTVFALLLVAAVIVFSPASSLAAQRDGAKPAGRARGQKGKPAAKARARQLAVAALLEAAEAARSVEQATDKVTIQATVADALWPLDEPAARAVLRRAWEFTTAPGALDAFRPEEEGARFGPRERIRAARQAVISCAAKHDTRLAESYLQEFERGLPAEEGEGAEGSAGEGAGGPAGGARREPSPEGWRRIWTANELLEDGAYEMAAAVAAPLVAEGANRFFLAFLFRLHDHSPRDAAPLYLRLLERTRADAAADANDVLLLSTPVVSPELFATIEVDGSTSLRPFPRDGGDRPAPAVAPFSASLRRAFFDAAAAVLLRQPPARGGAAPSAGEALAPYFAIGRLLPFFEREAAQYVAPLRARLTSLTQEIDESRRNAVSSQMQVRKLTPRNPTDPLQSQLNELARASTDEERDRARFNAVSAAAFRRLWDRARQLAGEIVDARTRRGALLLLAVEQVKSLGEAFDDGEAADDYERAAAFARAADVPAGVRAYGLAQAAELAARRGRRRRAAELLGEAAAAASQVDRGTGLRVVVYTLLAAAAARTGDARAWELLAELPAAVNEAGDRPEDEEGCAEIRVETADNSFCLHLDEQFPQPEVAFAAAARLDLARSLAEARALKDGAARALALVAAARVAVEAAGARR